MDKRQALEQLGFVLELGVYKKTVCEKDGTTYILITEPNRPGFKVDSIRPDGSVKTDGAGKYKDTPLYKTMMEITQALDDKIKEPVPEVEASISEPDDLAYSNVSDAVFEETGYQKSVPMRRPGRIIKGLTPRLAERGKIKIGKKGQITTSKNGNKFRPPTKFDHFEIVTMDKNADDDYILDENIMSRLEPGCRSINVRLPYDDPTLNFPSCYALYEGASCKCRGDGELALKNNTEIITCNPETCPHFTKNECKPNGILSVILDDAPTVGGVYKFRTVGWNSINNLISSMEFIRHLTNGILAGLPLVLTLTPKHTTIPGTKIPTVIYMVNLEYRGSLAEMAQAIKQTMDTRALMQYSVKDYEKLAEEALTLPEAPEECKDVVEEFYPESVKVA